MAVYSYDPPDRFIAGAIGQPGDRTFYLQASGSGRITSVVLEKFQVSQLAEHLDALLDEVRRRTGAIVGTDESLRDEKPLDLPLTEDFRAGSIALGWDHDRGLVIIEAQEATEQPVEPLTDDVPENGPAILRVRITAQAARAFSRRALSIVRQGRPPCPLCGLPLDPSGHVCPRQNGHRSVTG